MFDIIGNSNSEVKNYILSKNTMNLKVGDKLPSSELFYLDQNNDLKKINILDLCQKKLSF